MTSHTDTAGSHGIGHGRARFSAVAASLLCLSLSAPTEVNAAPQTYAYDALERLIRVDYPDGSSIAYTYDATGNRRSQVITVVDTDGDGLPDASDPDDDNDGVPDSDDSAPLDATNQGAIITLPLNASQTAQHGSGWGDNAYRSLLDEAATAADDRPPHTFLAATPLWRLRFSPRRVPP